MTEPENTDASIARSAEEILKHLKEAKPEEAELTPQQTEEKFKELLRRYMISEGLGQGLSQADAVLNQE